jgi:hypothetical protein
VPPRSDDRGGGVDVEEEGGGGEAGNAEEEAADHRSVSLRKEARGQAIGDTGTAAPTITAATAKAATSEKAVWRKASKRAVILGLLGGRPGDPIDAKDFADAVPNSEKPGNPPFSFSVIVELAFSASPCRRTSPDYGAIMVRFRPSPLAR